MDSHDWDNDTRLDRLVDGELTPAEYREFLQALEREPDGWRCAAMAFLEAQAWGQEIGTLRREAQLADSTVLQPWCTRRSREAPTGGEPTSVQTQPASGLRSKRYRAMAPFVLAIAASFLVAFGLGAWWKSRSVRFQPAPVAPSPTGEIAQDFESGSARESAAVPASYDPRQGISPEQLTFVVDRGNGQAEAFDMPVYEEDDRYARWLIEQPALPVEVDRALRRAGYRIDRQRRWAPVRLRDGRRAVFPIDELQITHASQRSY